MSDEEPDHETVLVTGDSMSPILQAGDVVRLFRDRTPRVGDLVVARHPFRRDVLLVKRVAAQHGDRYDLRGDNPSASTDSRTLGLFPASRILGVALPQPEEDDR